MRSWCVVAVALLGCGGSQAAEDRAVDRGDPEAEPSMLILPSVDVDHSELSEKMRFGWTLAEESFANEMPPPPPSGDTPDIQRWSEGDLRVWLERKSRTIEAARRELDAAAEESHRQRILAGAIVGLMYEDISRALRAIPVPAEIQREPEIAEIFRDVLDAQASPFLEHARRAYRACHLNARGEEGLTHWSRFCEIRKENLPPPRQ